MESLTHLGAIDLPSLLEATAAPMVLPASDPRVFDDPSAVWLIVAGSLDLFAVQRQGGYQTGAREHLGVLEAGCLIWGIDQSAQEDGIHLLTQSERDVRLIRLGIADLRKLAAMPSARTVLVAALDLWITALSRGVSKYLKPRKTPSCAIGPDDDLRVEDTDRVSCRRDVVWVEITSGIGRFADVTEVHAGGIVPIAAPGWLEARDNCRMIGHATEAMVQRPDLAHCMDLYHGWVFHTLAYDLRNATTTEMARLKKREDHVSQTTLRTFTDLAALLEGRVRPSPAATGEDALFECCSLIGRALGVTMTMPAWAKRRRANEAPLSCHDIAAASQVRIREVMLRGQWWREDAGPFLATLEESGAPVALIPAAGAGYVLHDPAAGDQIAVTESIAARLAPVAQCFYAGLPPRPLGVADLLRFGLRASRHDLVTLALGGALGGVVAALLPMATGYVFDSVIPGHQTTQMIQVGLALLAASFAAAAFRYTVDVAQLRIEGKLSATLQAALMDRLLRLPINFFSHYSAGDLAQRSMAIETIRTHLSGAVLSTLVGGVFSLFNLALLFYLSPLAGGITLGLLGLLAAVVVILGHRVIRSAQVSEDLSGKVSSLVLEIMSGIAKLRLAGAEERAFNLWGRKFHEMRRHQVKVRTVVNIYATFWAAYELLCLATIFWVVAKFSQQSLSTGVFLALVAAFVSLMASAGALSRAMLTVFGLVPLYRRATPILRASPETSLSKVDPGALTGDFEVSRVRFRYTPDGPLVLDGVSIAAQPGEFIALVGPSGCGKSTLMRLLLGMERPEAGGVFFDGHDLRGLDLHRLRSQIGVVLQNGRLIPGSIFENIQGGNRVTLEQCWDAAAQAGIAQDIEAMPMGMHTVLTEGTTALSGGQVQRILIARAIVGKPRVLLLDEATSALDNRVQAVVTESLNRLMVTRVVIAHRLSTIVNADRIYVLDRGRVVESGTYSELVAKGGLFSDLVNRQQL